MLRVIPNIDKELQPLQDHLAQTFLPSLFGTTFSADKQYVQQLAFLPIKHSGLSLINPVSSSSQVYQDSRTLTSHLVSSLQGTTCFSLPEHLAIRKETRHQIAAARTLSSDSTLDTILTTLPPTTSRILNRGKDTGHWLSLLPSTINDTIISPDEFRDGLHLRYDLTPPHLPQRCDGCLAPFTVTHSLKCKIGGLIVQRHDEVASQLGQLCAHALSHSSVHAEPLISPGHYSKTQDQASTQPTTPSTSTNTPTPPTPETPPEERGDLLIRGFWQKSTDCIVDVRITDTDQPTHLDKTPFVAIELQENEKKKKYAKKCMEQRRHFTPFVLSVDGMLGKEAQSFLKHLAYIYVAKWDLTYSQVRGYLNSKISIACLRAAHRCIRGSRVPSTRICRSHLQVDRPWEDGAGMNLFQS